MAGAKGNLETLEPVPGHWRSKTWKQNSLAVSSWAKPSSGSLLRRHSLGSSGNEPKERLRRRQVIMCFVIPQPKLEQTAKKYLLDARVVHNMLTIFTIMLNLYANKMLLLCSKSPTAMLKMFPRITHFLPKIEYNCLICLHGYGWLYRQH